jgi:hypothetical protein
VLCVREMSHVHVSRAFRHMCCRFLPGTVSWIVPLIVFLIFGSVVYYIRRRRALLAMEEAARQQAMHSPDAVNNGMVPVQYAQFGQQHQPGYPGQQPGMVAEFKFECIGPRITLCEGMCCWRGVSSFLHEVMGDWLFLFAGLHFVFVFSRASFV